jgi:hypothetical protein
MQQRAGTARSARGSWPAMVGIRLISLAFFLGSRGSRAAGGLERTQDIMLWPLVVLAPRPLGAGAAMQLEAVRIQRFPRIVGHLEALAITDPGAANAWQIAKVAQPRGRCSVPFHVRERRIPCEAALGVRRGSRGPSSWPQVGGVLSNSTTPMAERQTSRERHGLRTSRASPIP